jgi:hypothetical protein
MRNAASDKFWRSCFQFKPIETSPCERHDNVRRLIILICAFAVYLYAHHNWNWLPASTTIDRMSSKNQPGDYRCFGIGNQIKMYRIALGRKPLGAKQEREHVRFKRQHSGFENSSCVAVSTESLGCAFMLLAN